MQRRAPPRRSAAPWPGEELTVRRQHKPHQVRGLCLAATPDTRANDRTS